MKRSIERWRKCNPGYILLGSEAQVLFYMEDARADILELAAFAERVARLNRDAGEIGAGMLASLVDEARRLTA